MWHTPPASSLPRRSVLWCIVAVALSAAACVEAPQVPEPEPCTSQALLARNPATGACEWVSSCDNVWEVCDAGFTCEQLPAEACAFDARCAVQNATVCYDCAGVPEGDAGSGDIIACGCFDQLFCATRPELNCARFGEAACMASVACQPEYGWLDGLAEAPSEPNGGAVPMPAPCDGDGCETFRQPYPTWGFLGCQPVPGEPCTGLGEWSCLANAQCEPIYGGADCGCAYDPGDPSGERCACPDGERFQGCQNVLGPVCHQIGDPAVCDTLRGCHWEWDPTRVPDLCACNDSMCHCEPSVTDYGVCVPDDVPPPLQCADFADAQACTSHPACAWAGETYCECASADCWCSPSDAGYCYEAGPQTCWNFYDAVGCASAGCQWTPTDGLYPEPPCDCDANDEACGCTGDRMAAPGYCQPPVVDCWSAYDESTCWSNPACEWLYGAGEAPCYCDPSTDYCECDSGVRIDGYCQPRSEASCWDHFDQGSCSAQADCQWTTYGADPMPMPCACAPEDPACDCGGFAPPMDGYCEPRVVTCEQVYDAYACVSNPSCEWLEGAAPPPVCDCAPEDSDCGCMGFAPPQTLGYCQTRQTASCWDYFDASSCSADTSCQWSTGAGAMPFVPPCDCPANDPACVCDPIDCWGSWVDEVGQCRAPNDGIFPDYCCAGMTRGWCEPVVAEDKCGWLYDEWSCVSTGCAWYPAPCACEPGTDCLCIEAGSCMVP